MMAIAVEQPANLSLIGSFDFMVVSSCGGVKSVQPSFE